MLISVIIPCYNVERYISECIDSVIIQKYSNIEIICIDNNSTDGTLNILQEYKKKYADNFVILEEHKPGASCARNKGLSIARGEWIQFLDADDLLLKEKIEHQIRLLNENPSVAFLAASAIRQTVEGKESITKVLIGDSYKALFVTKLGNTCSNMFNRKKLEEIGGWDELLISSQETDLMFRLLKKDFVVVVDNDAFTIIRERESGQISQRDPREKWLQYIDIRLKIVEFLKTKKIDYFNKEMDFYYQNLFSQIRVLAQYDVDAAEKIFQTNFPKKFIPISVSGYSIYSFLFKLFGFKRAEQIKKWMQ